MVCILRKERTKMHCSAQLLLLVVLHCCEVVGGANFTFIAFRTPSDFELRA